jgi:hypothetical protein
MSLINDALKRARESQQKNPPSGAPPLPPVERPARGGMGWMLGLAAVLFLAAVGMFIGVTIFKHPAPPAVTAKAPEASSLPPVPAARAAVAPVPVPAPVSTSAPVLAPAPNAAPAMPGSHPQPAAPVEQLPTVQGVIFNSAHPVGIVNGKMVGIGDYVGSLQVKQILKNSIVFQQPDGSQRTVKIGG